MAIKIKDLLAARDALAAGLDISRDAAAEIVGKHHEEADTIAAFIAGDFSAAGVAPAVSSHSEKKIKPTAEKEKREREDNPAGAGAVPAVSGEIVTGDIISGGEFALPVGFADTVRGWLSDFQQKENIEDLSKLSGLQWHSVCMYIGQCVQASGVLRDKERERKEGGKIYNAQAVESLLSVWEYITGFYKHVPLVCDFISFSGVSRQWFYDYEGRGLTSSSVQIAKKAREIEESALSVALNDSRENPTGRIYYSKARLGWRETTEVIHTSATAAPAPSALPVFDNYSGLLTDTSGGDGV